MRDAHPGAIIGFHQRKCEYKRAPNLLEQNLASVEHGRPFDTACMPLQRPLDGLRLKPCPHRKVASIQIADTCIVPHPYTCIPEQHRAQVQCPDRIFATHVTQIRPRLR
jgi:hypothetical protein